MPSSDHSVKKFKLRGPPHNARIGCTPAQPLKEEAKARDGDATLNTVSSWQTDKSGYFQRGQAEPNAARYKGQ